jgi:hypothetical protein
MSLTNSFLYRFDKIKNASKINLATTLIEPGIVWGSLWNLSKGLIMAGMPKNVLDKSRGMTELVNASVVYSRYLVSNLGINRNYFLILCVSHLIQICRVLTLKPYLLIYMHIEINVRSHKAWCQRVIFLNM